MARRSKIDPCLFCGEAPCACNKPKVKKADTELAAMHERAARRAAGKPISTRATVRSSPTPTMTPDDLKLGAAVANLAAAGMLAATEQRRHEAIMAAAAGRSPELDRLILDWKVRRRGQAD